MIELKILFHRNLKSYRYQTAFTTEIPMVSESLLKAMQSIDCIEHSYFIINKNSVIVKPLYAWDGATGALIQSKNLRIPSLIHDIGCQAINLGLLPIELRQDFNKEYYNQCLLYDVCKPRACIHYIVITIWGMLRKYKILKHKENEKYSKLEKIEILK